MKFKVGDRVRLKEPVDTFAAGVEARVAYFSGMRIVLETWLTGTLVTVKPEQIEKL